MYTAKESMCTQERKTWSLYLVISISIWAILKASLDQSYPNHADHAREKWQVEEVTADRLVPVALWCNFQQRISNDIQCSYDTLFNSSSGMIVTTACVPWLPGWLGDSSTQQTRLQWSSEGSHCPRKHAKASQWQVCILEQVHTACTGSTITACLCVHPYTVLSLVEIVKDCWVTVTSSCVTSWVGNSIKIPWRTSLERCGKVVAGVETLVRRL